MTRESSSAPGAYNTHAIFRRVLATLIDNFVLGMTFFIITLPFSSIRSFEDVWEIASSSISGTLIFLLFILGLFAYYAILEGYCGQTVGKFIVGVWVVSEATGTHPGFKGAALRTVMRPVDGVGNYLVAFIVALFSDRDRRLGDMLAKTLVIRK